MVLKVLLTGQSGFIGRRLRTELLDRGHVVPPFRIDFRAAGDPRVWAPHLANVDVVINAAGIFRERQPGDFQAVHQRAPCALFHAAADAGVTQIIQLSALGADAGATSRFHLSKRAADECLQRLSVPSTSVHPSLVYGPGGASAGMLSVLASLPIIPVPGNGRQCIQPLHVDDLVGAVVALVESPPRRGTRVVPLVGPTALTLREYLAALRASLGFPKARFIGVPMSIMNVIARAAAFIPSAPLDPEALAMLERGNIADVSETRLVLGRLPRDAETFVPPTMSPLLRESATLGWMLPILRVAIAIMWVWTGVVSLGVYPVADSYSMLAAVGVPGVLAPFALYGAALLDLLMGALTLLLQRRRTLWQAQILLILAYTVIVAIRIPEHLLHPFGPILKNLPIVVILWMLMELEPHKGR